MAASKTCRLVAYYRVSTRKQGESGLGLEAQQSAVNAHATASGCRIIAEFTEVESGKKADRPELTAALALAKRTGATLVIAKLDRLSRNVAFLANLMDAGVEFVACDNPTANRLTLHILAAVAEDEAKRISTRTVAALAARRARSLPMGAEILESRNLDTATAARGRSEGAAASRRAATAFAADMSGIVAAAAKGKTLRQAAAALNESGYLTRRGSTWTAAAVARILERAEVVKS